MISKRGGFLLGFAPAQTKGKGSFGHQVLLLFRYCVQRPSTAGKVKKW